MADHLGMTAELPESDTFSQTLIILQVLIQTLTTHAYMLQYSITYTPVPFPSYMIKLQQQN